MLVFSAFGELLPSSVQAVEPTEQPTKPSLQQQSHLAAQLPRRQRPKSVVKSLAQNYETYRSSTRHAAKFDDVQP
jgi:hypothetical protein